ncbi:hypothetical protein ACJ72_05538 [Emergomyces africanus]|uniref:Methyltransferase domain-containing protein n=1 Tax=Emergomyces africanus TaxID=1955775 RepID=A0A1B7NTM9_9EURO|nr:hypothetical protein ACJ72_05538 [Emergomyces africanus]
MPRLRPSLLCHAYSIDPLLPSLLRECRDLPSAQNELRWLREYALAERRYHNDSGRWHGRDGGPPMIQRRNNNNNDNARLKLRLHTMVQQRARGVPLQYILGDQPFGELEILCRKGVLIPRPETESYTTRIANLLLSRFALKHKHGYKHLPALRIIDLCTGTGCIPLLLHSLLAPTFPTLQICGVDISTNALKLARENLEHNVKLGRLSARAREDISFMRGDVLSGLGDGGSMHMSSGSNEDLMDKIFPRITTTAVDVNYYSGSSTTKNFSFNNFNFNFNFTPRDPSGDNTTSGTLPISEKLGPQTNTGRDPITIVVSNPPYISPAQFINGTTARSVRKYEPRIALVPPPVINHGRKTETDADTDTNAPSATITAASTPSPRCPRGRIKTNEVAATTRREDMFYPHILSMGLLRLDADLVVLECGDKGQAGRVAEMARRVCDERLAAVGVWRCDGQGDGVFGFDCGPEEGEDGDDGGAGARAVVVKRGIFSG